MPFIPIIDRPEVQFLSVNWWVIWEGKLIAKFATKSAAHTFRKYLYKMLRVLHGSTTGVGSGDFVLALGIFLSDGTNPAGGFDPVMPIG